jgi:predicted secreted protein with PEFG-CTERM motif
MSLVLDDDVYHTGDDVSISGSIDTLVEGEQVTIEVEKPGGTGNTYNETPRSNGNFDKLYSINPSADDGVYTVKVTYDGKSVYTYFIVDSADDQVEVDVEDPTYQVGDEVQISGLVLNPKSGVDTVGIEIRDPHHHDVADPDNADVDSSDDFNYSLHLPSDAEHGRYAVTVTYENDDNDQGFAIFDVEDPDIGGSTEPITAVLSKSTYKPGDPVRITGEVDRKTANIVDIIVRDPDGAKIIDDQATLTSSDTYAFDFTLDTDAAEGQYTVTASYGTDDKVVNFTVSASGTSTLTLKLDKSSYLIGDTITITGKVSKIVKDATVNIVLYKPDATFAGYALYLDPNSDLTYSGTLRIRGDLEVADDYKLTVTYDLEEVSSKFSITGKSTATGDLTVATDKDQYAVGSTVKITGNVAPDLVVEGIRLTIQVYNPDLVPYRIDLVDVEQDGSYSYPLEVGGKLGIEGKYEVTATYNKKVATTTFEFGSGGIPGKPKYILKFEDQSFPIEYLITNGVIKGMFVKVSDSKLVISIDATADGKLTIVLPRNVIDSVEGGVDKKYVVATTDIEAGIGDENPSITESQTNNETRTLVIDYKKGTDLIEISGTSIVPEFGPISAIVLALAMVGIIAATARFSHKFNMFR